MAFTDVKATVPLHKKAEATYISEVGEANKSSLWEKSTCFLAEKLDICRGKYYSSFLNPSR